MKEAKIKVLARPKLKRPILIEGLPGLGLVGKIAIDHLIRSLKAKKFAELYSPHFPPIVIIMPDGSVRMIKNEFYYAKMRGKARDLILLTGDHQGLTVESFYEHAGKIIDFAKRYRTSLVITLGGLGTKKIVQRPNVFGAASSSGLVKKYQKYNIKFDRTGTQITGAAGLLLGLGKLKGIDGLCLMGETHGNYVDPNAAKAVLKVLEKILNIKLTYKELDSQSKQMKEMFKKLREIQKAPQKTETGKPLDLSYIR